MDEKLGRNSGVSEQLISYVKTVQDMIYAMLLTIKSIKNWDGGRLRLLLSKD
jgi:hypothetical protein